MVMVSDGMEPTILCALEKRASLADYSHKNPATLYTT